MRRSTAAMFAMRGAAMLAAAVLVGCAGHHAKPAPATTSAQAAKGAKARKPFTPKGPYTPGGLYAPDVADGAPAELPDVANLPEPVPHPEPLSRYGNRSPYVVLGKSYRVLPTAAGYDERGIASWYGTKFDGRMTSSLEPYDLRVFSAAHRTLPLPSYARVTNLENGRSVIVRINDRGPFHDGRLIDLSYAAAVKLGVNVHGTARVEVQGIDTGQMADVAKTSPPTRGPRAAAAIDAVALAPPQSVPATVATPPASANSAPPATGVTPDVAGARAANANPAAPSPSPATSSGIATAATPPAMTASAPADSNAAHAPIDPQTVGFLQVGSYNDATNANRMLARLIQAGVGNADVEVVQIDGKTLWRVHVGPFSADAAEHVAENLDALGFGHPPFYKK